MSLKWLKEKIVSIPSLSLLLIMDQALEYYGRALKRFESRRQENRGDSKIVIRISIIIKIVSSNIVARSENRNRSVHTWLGGGRKKEINFISFTSSFVWRFENSHTNSPPMFLGFTLWISTKVTGKTFQPWAKYRPSGIVASYIPVSYTHLTLPTIAYV